jgi:hypothetical protein
VKEEIKLFTEKMIVWGPTWTPAIDIKFFLLFWWDRVRTQGFALAKQVLYHLSHISSPI